MTVETYNEAYFEDGVGSNYHDYGDDPGWIVTVDVLRQFAPAESILYEVGCAKGFFVHWALKGGFQAYGCDVSEYATRASVSGLGRRIQQADAERLPWPARSADVMCSWELLEHMNETNVDGVLLQMDLATKPGGLMVHRIALTEPDGTVSFMDDCDATHTLMRPEAYWREQFSYRGYKRRPDVEQALNKAFKDRDWANRFFAYDKPLGAA